MKPRIYLEKMLAQDFDFFFVLTGNEKIMATITGRALSKEEAQKKFNSLLRNNELHKSFGSFKVIDAASSQVIGFSKLEITREKTQEAELGYMLLPEFWGRGLGNEIAETLLDVAISDPNLIRVYANTDPNNVASRKILMKNGFTSEEVGVIDGLPSEIFGRKLK